ncbi:MAG: TerB family tellurite resistance protein [Lentimicrobiaceae bacterium]|nr:TerB family tellurite resistance protein [Lentimicrobiaceae bacterium]MCL2131707.1 TerB family tellurite resistance protein [Lentimicrobiaceae bacterium]
MKNNFGCLANLFFVFTFVGYGIAEVEGAICGFVLVLLINRLLPENKPSYSKVIDEKVLGAITKLSWIIIKADEGVSESELYVFRDYMLQNFGNAATADAIDIMQYLQYEKVTSAKATQTINAKLNYAEKMQILQFLFQLAAADGEIHSSELEILNQIAEEMQISSTDFTYLKNAYNYMYNNRYYRRSDSEQNQYAYSPRRPDALANAYAVLGVKNTTSNQEIKAAYRRLAIANHPDKVQHLGETAHSEAEKRFSQINEAYNRVKKERGM